jgi:hypothetical protein
MLALISVGLTSRLEVNQHVSLTLKDSVTRLFTSGFFFITQLLLVPIGMPRNYFDFLRIFVELFVFVINSPVMNSPGSRLESLRLANVF